MRGLRGAADRTAGLQMESKQMLQSDWQDSWPPPTPPRPGGRGGATWAAGARMVPQGWPGGRGGATWAAGARMVPKGWPGSGKEGGRRGRRTLRVCWLGHDPAAAPCVLPAAASRRCCQVLLQWRVGGGRPNRGGVARLRWWVLPRPSEHSRQNRPADERGEGRGGRTQQRPSCPLQGTGPTASTAGCSTASQEG